MVSIAFSAEARRPLASGDIAGRDLLIPGMGWIGHVGLGTGDDVGKPTQIIIEVLNESPVIQFNTFNNFTSRSRYWGSRSGIGDYSSGTYAVLVEAFHQSWWCPSYSTSTAYVIGQGNPANRVPTKCGFWRCDTYVAWDFYSAGYSQIMNNRIMLPLNVFNTFPYANGDAFSEEFSSIPNQIPLMDRIEQQFSELTAEELNKLPYEKFVELADIPMAEETPTHIAKEWEFLFNPEVNEAKRSVFIDRLAVSNEPDVISKFISLYDEIHNDEIKSKLVQGLMIYYQNHWEQTVNTSDFAMLKQFYSKLLNQELSPRDADKVIRGFIDLHSASDVRSKLKLIEDRMVGVEPSLQLGLKLELAYKSKKLEDIYIPSIISMLKEYNRSDLDGMFFGITKQWYKNLKRESSIDQIKDYLTSAKKRFSQSKGNQDDLYFNVAKIAYKELADSLTN
ncbi:hypothetical protein B1207_15205 [Legionella quinlivanii]|uniref:Uncharacterized protein n=2 Tax=Legionella quinlivanii TaxID=45073 RepID=A0A364LFG5_9GAMM|nr:hypothetical protein B1207_15205 [Legionella quinlivanii]